MKQPIFDQLNRLLDKERTALLHGDFEKISTLLKEKEALLEAISAEGSARDVDAPVMAKLRRNLTLYDEALAGLRAVAERIGATAQPRSELRFYRQDGDTTSLTVQTPKGLEKRA
ncbi:hypothetical protein SAMN05421759_10146 [Roseivivax lentus]|uniref:FlgN protein n=1 Tax=Roseivivax lentus TaxID=633194 RepID=A0A1N7JKW3_9RHOB|nr:flagellar protein FlgN [Roseivivax lentus]SIS49950.1 hypothetical protein SAMN05421759_10146 [Roseivivax lentus]